MKIGKCSFPDPDAVEAAAEKMTDAQKEIWEKKKEILEKQKTDEGDEKAILVGIGEDLVGDGELVPSGEPTPAWSFKSFGDQGTYPDDKSHKVIAARSLIWPGAVTVAQGTKFANIYIGYAMKCGSLVPVNPVSQLPLDNTCPFSPLWPDPVMDEPTELIEEDEPNPKEDDGGDDDGDSVIPDDD
jgi:hypothetical protein